jgi:hypothetical protein
VYIDIFNSLLQSLQLKFTERDCYQIEN